MGSLLARAVNKETPQRTTESASQAGRPRPLGWLSSVLAGGFVTRMWYRKGGSFSHTWFLGVVLFVSGVLWDPARLEAARISASQIRVHFVPTSDVSLRTLARGGAGKGILI